MTVATWWWSLPKPSPCTTGRLYSIGGKKYGINLHPTPIEALFWPMITSLKTLSTGRCEVLVVGGGPSGLSAALAARRAGADVILMERFGCFGGVITTVQYSTVQCSAVQYSAVHLDI